MVHSTVSICLEVSRKKAHREKLFSHPKHKAENGRTNYLWLQRDGIPLRVGVNQCGGGGEREDLGAKKTVLYGPWGLLDHEQRGVV